jgi:RNA polymerase sigma-70 factor (ECF subfamily)
VFSSLILTGRLATMQQRRDAEAPPPPFSPHDVRGRAGPSLPRGEYDAFLALIPESMGAMLRVAGALVGLADAEDAAQEAVLRGWQAWPSLRDHSMARAWLLSITVNLCKDWHRGRFGTRRRLDEPLRDDRDHADHAAGQALALIGSDPGASDAAAALDLRQAINTLDPELRVLIALRHYAGMDSSEIGALLGMPPATVRTRLRRALAELRERLRGPQDPNPTRSRPLGYPGGGR